MLTLKKVGKKDLLRNFAKLMKFFIFPEQNDFFKFLFDFTFKLEAGCRASDANLRFASLFLVVFFHDFFF